MVDFELVYKDLPDQDYQYEFDDFVDNGPNHIMHGYTLLIQYFELCTPTLQTVKHLFKHTDPEIINYDGVSVMYSAVNSSASTEIIEFVIQNTTTEPPIQPNGITILQQALWSSCRLETIQLLLESYKIDVNYRGPHHSYDPVCLIFQ